MNHLVAATRLLASCLVVASVCACTTTSMLGRGTRALEATARSMDQTRDVLRRSEGTMGHLAKSLQSLHAPMEKLGALHAPMNNLGSLATNVDQLGQRLQGVETNLQRLEQPLQNVAALEGPLVRLRALEKPLQTIASVGRDETKVWLVCLGVLAAWMAATAVGVYGGFGLAMRRQWRIARHARSSSFKNKDEKPLR